MLEAHVQDMRALYGATLKDMHLGLSCFWNRRPPSYEQLVGEDAMFPFHGAFYGMHRKRMADLENINLFSSFGFTSPMASSSTAYKRQSLAIGASSTNSRAQKRQDQAPKLDYSRVASFSSSVSEEEDMLTIRTTLEVAGAGKAQA